MHAHRHEKKIGYGVKYYLAETSHKRNIHDFIMKKLRKA